MNTALQNNATSKGPCTVYIGQWKARKKGCLIIPFDFIVKLQGFCKI